MIIIKKIKLISALIFSLNIAYAGCDKSSKTDCLNDSSCQWQTWYVDSNFNTNGTVKTVFPLSSCDTKNPSEYPYINCWCSNKQ